MDPGPTGSSLGDPSAARDRPTSSESHSTLARGTPPRDPVGGHRLPPSSWGLGRVPRAGLAASSRSLNHGRMRKGSRVSGRGARAQGRGTSRTSQGAEGAGVPRGGAGVSRAGGAAVPRGGAAGSLRVGPGSRGRGRCGPQGCGWGLEAGGDGVPRGGTGVSGQGAPGSPGLGSRVRGRCGPQAWGTEVPRGGPGPKAPPHARSFLCPHARPLREPRSTPRDRKCPPVCAGGAGPAAALPVPTRRRRAALGPSLCVARGAQARPGPARWWRRRLGSAGAR